MGKGAENRLVKIMLTLLRIQISLRYIALKLKYLWLTYLHFCYSFHKHLKIYNSLYTKMSHMLCHIFLTDVESEAQRSEMTYLLHKFSKWKS